MAIASTTRTGKSASPATKSKSDAPTFHATSSKRLEVLPGQYFVRVHPGAVRPHVEAPRMAPAGASRKGFARMALTADVAASVPESIGEPLDFLRNNLGLKNVRPLFSGAGAERICG